jgi:hypothetical protein
MFSSKSPKVRLDTNTLAVVIAVLFVIVTLPATWKLVGNTLAMIGLPTEVKEVSDAEGNTCQSVPMLLVLVHAVVLALLAICVTQWYSKRN